MKQKKTRITLRFLRDMEFPRFKMTEGEIWDCYEEHGTGKDYLEAVAHGEDRFCFAGGICLVEDVEIIEGLDG
jgi:hypothetical protein